jgi:hypothetical protein
MSHAGTLPLFFCYKDKALNNTCQAKTDAL